MIKIPTIEVMLKAGMHFGHRTSKWHPKMEPFIFTSRNGVHIIDLMKTQKMLLTALELMKKFASEGKTILMVGTKMQVKEPLKQLSIAAGMPYVTGKWLGGTMTNFLIIKKMTKKYMDMVKARETGDLEKYTKKERLDLDRTIEKLEQKVGGLVNMNKLPDAIFIWDIKKEKNAMTEAIKKNIPIIAVCDTNSNPTNINYLIPSNDDATKTIKLLTDLIKETLLEGKAEGAKPKV